MLHPTSDMTDLSMYLLIQCHLGKSFHSITFVQFLNHILVNLSPAKPDIHFEAYFKPNKMLIVACRMHVIK